MKAPRTQCPVLRGVQEIAQGDKPSFRLAARARIPAFPLTECMIEVTLCLSFFIWVIVVPLPRASMKIRELILVTSITLSRGQS